MNASRPDTILVIDPDPAFRVLILALLRREGYLAEGTDDPNDALRLHQSAPYTAVVMDPRIRAGDKLLCALHAPEDAETPRRNVIVVTAPDGAKERYAGHPRVHAVLFKPFFLSELAAAVAACCGRAN